MINVQINDLIQKLIVRSNEISEERKILLNSFAEYITGKTQEHLDIKLIFICTHNSRRSHMGQIWAQVAAEYLTVPNVNCFSGGTEVTAFNPRAVEALRDGGFRIIKKDESQNPIYLVYFSDEKKPLNCYSKLYNDPFNPQTNFVAIVTCSDADEKCPVIIGSEKRFPIRYNDPKEFENTDKEAKMYKETSEQIAIEMVYVFSQVAK